MAREYLECVRRKGKNKQRQAGEGLAGCSSDSNLGLIVFCTFLIQQLESLIFNLVLGPAEVGSLSVQAVFFRSLTL